MHRRTVLGGAGLAALPAWGRGPIAAPPISGNSIPKIRKRDVMPAPHRPNPKAWPDRGIHAAWLGHTTVLLKLDGTTILTDPVFSARVGLDLGDLHAGAEASWWRRRWTSRSCLASTWCCSPTPTWTISIFPSLRRLENRGTNGSHRRAHRRLLRPGRTGGVRELGLGRTRPRGAAGVERLPREPIGARACAADTYRGYNGYVIRGRTLPGAIRRRHRATDAFRALKTSRPVRLGHYAGGSAYNPGFTITATPEESWRMANDAGAEVVLPVHHQTFPLSASLIWNPSSASTPPPARTTSGWPWAASAKKFAKSV